MNCDIVRPPKHVIPACTDEQIRGPRVEIDLNELQQMRLFWLLSHLPTIQTIAVEPTNQKAGGGKLEKSGTSGGARHRLTQRTTCLLSAPDRPANEACKPKRQK